MKATSKATYPIDQYKFSDTDEVLLDANIWLFVYGPQYSAADQRTAVYSDALKRMLTAKSCIFIDVLVLSEFVNSFARFSFNTSQVPKRTKDFKSFRKSAAFKPVARQIADACRRIMSHGVRTESGFASLNFTALIDEFELGLSDLNDQVLIELCKTRGLKFVTHDSDFKGRNLTLLTANRNLLKTQR